MKYRKILLIDDNEVDNTINKFLVSQFNLAENIIVKNSAIEALKYLNEHKNFPELIFLDINMPVMDGFGFLEKFVGMDNIEKEKSQVVMLTSSQDEKDIERAKQFPCVIAYVSKPLSKTKLSDLLLLIEIKTEK